MSKSKRGKSASANEISKWETELIQAPFNEETWRSCVFFIAPGKFEDNVYVDIMSDVIATGLRKLFSVITEENLLRDIREFGKGQTGGGKGKGGSARPPPFFEVCEQAKALLDQGENIPPTLMAKVLKFKLLQIKQKDLDRREEEKKAAKAAEAAKKDDKGKKSRSPSGKRSKSPGKKKGKKEADTPASPKKDTKLKRRGDVEDTFKTIDDEPDDEGCPQHYTLIHGTLMAQVIQYLTDIGVNVDSVICMKSETYDKFEPKEKPEEGTEKTTEELDPEELEKGIKEEEQLAQKKEFETRLENFWKESDNLVIKAPSGNKLKDIAKYEVIVRDKDVPEENLKELPDEKKTEFGTIMFEDVAVKCYNMLDHFNLYKQYLDSMKLLHVPIHSTTSTVSSTSLRDIPSSQSAQGIAPAAPDGQTPIYVEVDTRYYKHLMDTVPPESHSVPLMVHCMLEQVTATVDDNNPLDKETPPRDDGLNSLLAAHISSKVAKLPLSQDDKMSVSDNMSEEKKPVRSSSPMLLYHNDDLTARTFHLKPLNNLNPMEVEQQMLQFTHNYTEKIPELDGRETAERAACTNELNQFMKSKTVDAAVLDQALKQYAFEGMLLKSVSDDGDIIDPVELDDAFRSYDNPWDHPYSKLEDFMKVKFCSDESGKLKISEIENSSPLTSFRNLDDWSFMEYFDRTTLLQMLEEARFSLPYMDTYYHKKDHSLLVALHNPVGQNRTSQTTWKTKLHSNVGFRNYLDNVATSISTWVDDQERKRIEAARTPTPPPVVIEEPQTPLKEGSRYGLITRTEMNALKAEEEEKNKKGKGKKSARGTRSPGRASAKSRAKDHSPDKKDKKRDGSATSRPKSGRSSAKGSQRSASGKDKKGSRSRSRLGSQENLEETTPQPTEPQVEEIFDFIGYDVGDNLIHAAGSLMTLFPSDGGQIRVDKSTYVQGSKTVRVSVYKDGNAFILHFLDPIDEILPKENGDQEQPEKEETENADEQSQEHIEKSEIESTEKESLQSISKKVKPLCDFSSFVAQFNDGMTLTHSGYGPSGSIIDGELKEVEVPVPGIIVPDSGVTAHGTPSPQPKAASPKARKKMDEEAKRMEELLQQQEEEKQRLEDEAKKRAEEERNKKPFQHIYITCPDGLHVDFFNDGQYPSNGDKGGVAVRQRYPVKGTGKQDCENLRQKPAMEELSRTILTNGTVLKFMKDNGVQVLFPDGATSKCQTYPSRERPSSAAVNKPAENTPAKKGARATSQKQSEEPLVPVLSLPDKIPQWISTGIGGARVGTKENGEIESMDGVLYSLATCTETGQVLRTREDNVVTIERPDGSTVVEHEDGTRITTFYHEIERQTQVPDNETGIEAQYDMYQGRFVKVECPGFATLVFNLDEGSCGTIFGNGVNIETCADGVTTVDRIDGSQLHIDNEGIITFAPRDLAEKIDLAASEPANEPVETPAGVYTMRSNNQMCCEMKDLRGSHFTVMSNGDTSINKTSQTDEKSSNEPLTCLVPRYFVVHEDGSGFELLRQSDVSEFLSKAEEDPSSAVLRSPVEGLDHATGITVLKPYSGGVVKVWLMSKDEDKIVPQAIRERDFETFPAKEEKRDGPKFGTNVGAGLNIGGVVKKTPTQRPITCPKALELRQLIQYKPLTDEQRQTIVTSMKDYGEYVKKRQDKLDSILPQDPRDDSEKLRAEELNTKMEGDNQDFERKTNPETVNESTDTVAKTKDIMSNKLQSDEVSTKYIEAITPAPEPVPPPPRWKRSQSEWERDKIELAELEYGKNALRNKQVPPYFDTSNGQSFLRLEYSSDDINMADLTSQLAEQTRHPPPGEVSVPDTPDSARIQKSLQDFSSPEALQQTGGTTSQLNNDTVSPSTNTLSPHNLRPTNPTPAHATGDGTPTPLRPNNPTPAHATYKPVRPSNPTPKHAADQREGLVTSTESPNYDSAQWTNNLESVQEVVHHDGDDSKNGQSEDSDVNIYTPGNPMTGAKSLYIDVTGTMRKDTVKLPSSILSSKPGALPNSQFIEVEDPVRRRVNTVSVAGGNKVAPGRVESLRGFELLPPKVSFGVLKEGCTYIQTVLMKNVGIDSCRFKIKQPPPSTGLRVLYNPGPVAAGMNTKLDIEIFAVAVGVVGETGVGQIGHHVEIVTETDVIYLPVYATIMTAYEYGSRYGDQTHGLASGTTLVPNRPPSRDPTRPRKPEDYALLDQTNAAS